MRITFDGRIPHPSYASIGMDGEHNAEIITLDGLPEHDGKTVVLNIILPNGTADALAVTNGQVTITRNTTLPGTATAWVSIHDGTDYVWKSEKIKLRVGELPDIDTPIDQQYPGIVDDVAAMADEAAAAASQAVEAAESVTGMTAQATTLDPWESATASYSNGVLSLGIPRGTQGVQGQKGDKGDKGDQGPKGEKGDTGSTGATGADGAPGKDGADGKDGKDGADGVTPSFSIGTVTAGTTAAATITGTTAEPVLNLTLPKGDTGSPGSPGQDGTSPTASVSKAGTVATITITDKNGTTTATVSDGSNGAAGQGVPTGGTTGQVLKKKSGTNYDTEWGDAGSGLPTGGSAGQVLRKNSGNTGVEWGTIDALPAYNYNSNYHKVLCAKYPNGPSWEYPGAELQLEEYWNPDLPGTYAFNGYDTYLYSVYEMFKGGILLSVITNFSSTHEDFETADNNARYIITNATMDDSYTQTMGLAFKFVLEKMREDGSIYKKILNFLVDDDYEFYYAVDVTPNGIVSNTVSLTQAEYDALVQAGTVDSQTLYCIKETV